VKEHPQNGATIMATTRYEEALRQVESLSPADQKRLLEEIAHRLDALPEQPTSILQLRGLERTFGATSMPTSTSIGNVPRGLRKAGTY